MSSRARSLLACSLLAGACSAEPSTGADSPATGSAGGHDAGAAGATTTGGVAGQAQNTGGSTAGTLSTAGSNAVTGGAAGSASGGNAGASGTATNAGDDCVPGASIGLDASFAEVVVDRSTCLVWQRHDPIRDMAACALQRADIPSSLCFAAAQAYCAALVLDGQSDWRLPTVSELQTLVVSPPPTPPTVPTIDHDAFPEAVANLYWSSELIGGKVHCVDFNGGPPTNNTGPDGPQALRCVRP